MGTLEGNSFLTEEEAGRIREYQRGDLVLRLLQLKGNPFGSSRLFAMDSQYIEGELQVKFEMAAVQKRTGIELLQVRSDGIGVPAIDVQDPDDAFGRDLFAGRYDNFLIYLHRNLGVEKLSLSSARSLCESQKTVGSGLECAKKRE